jgi:hypothetical protein
MGILTDIAQILGFVLKSKIAAKRGMRGKARARPTSKHLDKEGGIIDLISNYHRKGETRTARSSRHRKVVDVPKKKILCPPRTTPKRKVKQEQQGTHDGATNSTISRARKMEQKAHFTRSNTADQRRGLSAQLKYPRPKIKPHRPTPKQKVRRQRQEQQRSHGATTGRAHTLEQSAHFTRSKAADEHRGIGLEIGQPGASCEGRRYGRVNKLRFIWNP